MTFGMSDGTRYSYVAFSADWRAGNAVAVLPVMWNIVLTQAVKNGVEVRNASAWVDLVLNESVWRDEIRLDVRVGR